MHSMAVLLKSGVFKKLFTAYCFTIKEKFKINFRYLSEIEVSSIKPGIFDNLTSLETL